MRNLLFLSALCMIIACNNDKTVDPMSIYGYWESMDLGKDTENPIGLKLDFQDSIYAFVDPVVSDTIFYYHTCKIENDSLFLQYDREIKKYCIKELSDTKLVLNVDGKNYKYIKKVVYYENGKYLVRLLYQGKKETSTDSLDVIVKSKRETNHFDGSFIISEDEMQRVRTLAFDYLDNHRYKSQKMYNDLFLDKNDYVRQYLGINEDGTKYVYIDLNDRFANLSCGYITWKEEILNMGYTIKIDLNQNKVVDFYDNRYDL